MLQQHFEEKINKPSEPEQNQASIGSILADPTQSKLFGFYLQQNGEDGAKLAESLHSGNISKEDLDKLTQQQQAFTNKLESTEFLKKNLINENTISHYVNSSPELQKIQSQVGAGNMLRVVESYIQKMALSNPEEFNKIRSQAVLLESFKTNEYAQQEQKIKNTFKDYKITDENAYAKIIRDPNLSEKDKKRAVRTLVQSGMSWWEKTGSRLTSVLGYRESSERMKDLAKLNEESKGTVEEYKEYIDKLGGVIGASLSSNDDERHKIVAEILTGKNPEIEKKSISFKDAQKFVSQPELDIQYQEYFKQQRVINPSISERKLINDFRKKKIAESQVYEKTPGWGALCAILFGSKISVFEPSQKEVVKKTPEKKKDAKVVPLSDENDKKDAA